MPTSADVQAIPPFLTTRALSIAMCGSPPRAPHLTAEQHAAYLRRWTHCGDPEADAVVAMFRRLPTGEGRKLFDTALENGIDTLEAPPPELIAFFATIDDIPYWVDHDEIDLACRVVGRTGLIGIAALSMGALCGGYLASRVTKPLVRTGELERMAPRRLAETLAWWTEVTTPGGMARFERGFTTTVRVRLMHALVRAGLARREDWDYDAWDHPLNASQLAGTIMLFGFAHLAGSRACGLHINARERRAVYSLWRWVGHVMGVRPEIVPSTDRDFERMYWLQAEYEFSAPDINSRRLARALIDAVGPIMSGPGTDRLNTIRRAGITELMSAYGRLLLGPRNADHLGLSDRKVFQGMVTAVTGAITVLEFPRRFIPGATRWCERAGRRSQLTINRRATLATHANVTYSRHDRAPTGTATTKLSPTRKSPSATT